eukprot:gene16251-22130_t
MINIKEILHFYYDLNVSSIRNYGSGLINKTFLVTASTKIIGNQDNNENENIRDSISKSSEINGHISMKIYDKDLVNPSDSNDSRFISNNRSTDINCDEYYERNNHHKKHVRLRNHSYIFQIINEDVFADPTLIDENINRISRYLDIHYPQYSHLRLVPSIFDNQTLLYSLENDYYFRLFYFIDNSTSYNTVDSPEQAYAASQAFGIFSRVLSNFDYSTLNITIPYFHDLTCRFEEYLENLSYTSNDRLNIAKPVIELIQNHADILITYQQNIVGNPMFKLRVMHHDTKISNCLFRKNEKKKYKNENQNNFNSHSQHKHDIRISHRLLTYQKTPLVNNNQLGNNNTNNSNGNSMWSNLNLTNLFHRSFSSVSSDDNHDISITIHKKIIYHNNNSHNNSFIDNNNYEALCVVDLDTVMPGLIISDIGDMIRTYSSPISEESECCTHFTTEELDQTIEYYNSDFINQYITEMRNSKVKIRIDFVTAIIEGYLDVMGKELTDEEKHFLIFSGKYMIYMQAIRFLSDFLDDDRYYSTNYTLHNLCRAINQLVLLEDLIMHEDQLKISIIHLLR